MKMRTRGQWLLLLMFVSRLTFGQIPVRVDSFYVSAGDSLTIPVFVGDVTNSNIVSFQFDLFFCGSVLSLVNVTLDGTIAEDWGGVFFNTPFLGELRIGAFGLHPLAGGGALVKICFKAIGKDGESSPLMIENFLFNDGIPKVRAKNGFVLVKKSIQLNIASNLAGAVVTIDGNRYETPVSLHAFIGTSHIVTVDSVQGCGEGVRCIFQKWEDGQKRTRTITVDLTNINLRAIFLRQFYLNIQSTHGTPRGEGWYDADLMAPFSVAKYDWASDSIRFRFLYWAGDVFTTNLSDSLRMDTSKTVIATFAEEDFVFINLSEKNMGYTIPPPPGLWVEKGNMTNVVAYPLENFCFFGWSGDINSRKNPLLVAVHSPLHIQANFGKFLPVQLLFLKIEEESENSIRLYWKTGVEKNNYGFYIQRRRKSTEFQDVAFVKGKGPTTTGWNYFFVDKNLRSGSYSYRLKQVDLNGRKNYSDVVNAFIPQKYTVSILRNYPNPFSSKTTLCINLQKEDQVELKIYNLLGQLVYHVVRKNLPMGIHNFDWSGENDYGERVSDGVYIVNLKTSRLSVFHKIVKFHFVLF